MSFEKLIEMAGGEKPFLQLLVIIFVASLVGVYGCYRKYLQYNAATPPKNDNGWVAFGLLLGAIAALAFVVVFASWTVGHPPF